MERVKNFDAIRAVPPDQMEYVSKNIGEMSASNSTGIPLVGVVCLLFLQPAFANAQEQEAGLSIMADVTYAFSACQNLELGEIETLDAFAQNNDLGEGILDFLDRGHFAKEMEERHDEILFALEMSSYPLEEYCQDLVVEYGLEGTKAPGLVVPVGPVTANLEQCVKKVTEKNPDAPNAYRQIFSNLCDKDLIAMQRGGTPIIFDIPALDSNVLAITTPSISEYEATYEVIWVDNADFSDRCETHTDKVACILEIHGGHDDDSGVTRTQDVKETPSAEKIRARHILLETEAEAKLVISLLEEGRDFAAVAKEFSIGPSAEKGGDLGFFGRGQMVPAFEEAAFALGVGDVSAPVKTKFGWHVIKVEEQE